MDRQIASAYGCQAWRHEPRQPGAAAGPIRGRTGTPDVSKSTKSSNRKPAAASAPAAAATAARGPRFGPTECHAPGCDGTRYLKNSLLCQEHEQAWRQGTFRLSARGYAKLNAANVAAGKPVIDPATAAPARGAAAKRIAAAVTADPAPADELEQQLAASVAARFATPELAAAAVAKRRAAKSASR
jgi:hypothetical protein